MPNQHSIAYSAGSARSWCRDLNFFSWQKLVVAGFGTCYLVTFFGASSGTSTDILAQFGIHTLQGQAKSQQACKQHLSPGLYPSGTVAFAPRARKLEGLRGL